MSDDAREASFAHWLPATLESFRGDAALCRVEVWGTELPVELPAELLAARGLTEGMRFLWMPHQDGSVEPDDLMDAPPCVLTEAEESEARRLYEEFLSARSLWLPAEWLGDQLQGD